MAENDLSEIWRDLEPYLVKSIRDVIGQQKGEGMFFGGFPYAVFLFDHSAKSVIFYAVGEVGGEYTGITDAMAAADSGDLIWIPNGQWQGTEDTGDAIAGDVNVAGMSRAGTVFNGGFDWALGGASCRNFTITDSANSAADLNAINLYGAGQLVITNTYLTMDQQGSGDVAVVAAGHADAVIHVYNSHLYGNASGSGSGYCVYSDGEVHLHNCTLEYTTDVIDPSGSGKVFIDGSAYNGEDEYVVEIDDTDSPYTPLNSGTIIVDASGGAVTITPPAISGIAGRYHTVKVIDSTNTVTIDPSGAETIDGQATITMVLYDAVKIVAQSNEWSIL